MRAWLRRQRTLALLLAAFIAASLALQRVMPALEGSDEVLHFNYTMLLLAENRLPDRTTRATNATRQASGQPPLSYWVGALALRALGLPAVSGDALLQHLSTTARNPWYAALEPWARHDNRINFIHGADERLLGQPDAVAAARVLSVLSTAWGALAVIGAYGAAGEVFQRRTWRMTATAIFAFMPTMVYISSYITNDTAATAFSALALWAALRLMRTGTSPRRLIVLGALLALGMLSKVSVLLIAPAAGLALVIAWRDAHAGPGRIARDVLCFALPLAVLALPWVAYGALTYGDPFGFNTHRHATVGFYFEQPRSLAEIVPLLPHLYLSYWGWSFFALLDPLVYTLLGGLLALSAAGYALSRRGRRWSALRQRQALVLLAAFVVVLLGMIRWMQQLSFTGGRLMYPAHVAVALGLTGGLYLLARRWPRLDFPLRVGSAVLLSCAGLVFPLVAMRDAYHPPPLQDPAALPALEGGPVDFDSTIRLLGLRQPDRHIHGGLHPVELCWQVLRATDRPAAYSLKLVRDGVIVADRTTLFGTGRFPSQDWRPGDTFCDSFNLWMDDPDLVDDPLPAPGTAYDLVLVVLDARTQAADWVATTPDGQPIATVRLGQAASPAGAQPLPDLPNPDVHFPGFARLAGAALQGAPAPGEAVTLQLGWQVQGSVSGAWSQFVHLYGPHGFVGVLADGPPRAGAYPLWAWQAGDQFADSWTFTLPEGLAPGRYSIRLGFYRPGSGERLPAAQGGQPAPDQSPAALTFTVE